jgi:hypothetical protein
MGFTVGGPFGAMMGATAGMMLGGSIGGNLGGNAQASQYGGYPMGMMGGGYGMPNMGMPMMGNMGMMPGMMDPMMGMGGMNPMMGGMNNPMMGGQMGMPFMPGGGNPQQMMMMQMMMQMMQMMQMMMMMNGFPPGMMGGMPTMDPRGFMGVPGGMPAMPPYGHSRPLPPFAMGAPGNMGSSGAIGSATGNLVNIGGKLVDSSIAPNIMAMIQAAARDGVNLNIKSGFRSHQEQQALYARYGPGRAATPGSSNHERGLAVDFANNRGAYAWLNSHAQQFGLKTNIHAGGREPWHVSPTGR